MKPIILICVLILFLLSGCQPVTPKNDAGAPHVRVNPTPDAQVAVSTSTQASELNFTPTPMRQPVEKGDLNDSATPRLRLQPLEITSTDQPEFKACSPLEGHTWADLEEIMTNPFDPPPPGKDAGHHGVDFAYYQRGTRPSIEGVPIDAVLSGAVAAVIKNRPPYGNMVIVESPGNVLPTDLRQHLGINPGESLYLLYAHMKETPLVVTGQAVGCGDQLGEVGNTPAGWSSAPHLHFEVHIGPIGRQFASMAYYDNSITLEEKSNYETWRMSGTFRMLDPMRLLGYVLNR